MQFSESLNELLYNHEILRAKVELRDHYFKTIVKEIYENTGQLLSLVHFRLSALGSRVNNDLKSHITESGDIIGQTIRDLRDMSRNFYPENEILSESGLINALKRELKVDLEDNTSKKVKVKGIPFALEPGPGLIFYFIILEITFFIASINAEDSLELKINYTKTSVKISINYLGKPIDFERSEVVRDKSSTINNLDVQARIKLVGGQLTVRHKPGKRTGIDISMPSDKNVAA